MTSSAPTTPKPEKRGETIKTLVYAIVLALIFRSLAYEPFHIPSGSMKANLLIGDYLFVSKFSYGYSRYSFPFGVFPIKGRVFKTAPQRGDVIVFRLPTDTSTDYIKRLIGLPGDRIQVRDGVLYINGREVKRERVEDYSEYDDESGAFVSVPRYRETLPEGKSYLVLDQTRFGEVDNTEEYVVPEGHYFFMGDNRDNSVDSRYLDRVGFVPEENLVGRAELILFSADTRSKSLRTNRFFTHIH